MSVLRRLRARLSSAVWVNAAVRLDRTAICSFTFDDCPESALDAGGAKLASVGAQGTYYISAEFYNEADESDPCVWGERLVEARSAGHEIGCHTYSHRPLPEMSLDELNRELDRNLAAIRKIIPDIDLATFSYPFGETSLSSKRVVARRFGASRGVREGLNGRILDLSEIKAVHIVSRTFDRDRIKWFADRAARKNAWLVFVAHDVRQEPSDSGCTPEEFGFVVDTVRDAGLEILTVRSAVGRITHRAPRD